MRVLFLCTGNSARSQMAEALLRAAAAQQGEPIEVASAGTHPKGVNPLTVEVLAERGLDIGEAESKSLDGFLDEPWDLVITVCDDARETCPVFPGAERMLHWGLRDPAAVEGPHELRLAAFREARETIAVHVARFLETGL